MQPANVQSARRALITGAGGFIGHHLVDLLHHEGWIVATTGVSEGGPGHHRLAALDADSLRSVVEAVSPDWIFHLAGTTSDSPTTQYTVNTCFGIHLLQAAARVNAGVLLTGSAAEYGPQHANPPSQYGRAVDECCPCQPVSTYGISKYAQSLHGLAASAGQPVIIVRPFNVLGKGMPEHLALGRFVRQALQLPATGDRCIHTGPLHGVRDFIHVRDCAQALIHLTETKDALGKVVNLCSGTGVSLAHLAECLIAQLSPAVRIQEAAPAKPVADVFVGTGAALRQLGLSIPPCALHQCIKEMLS
ncbi:NAD-dependent epimerase/dehydratase family protein [Desulfovibrio aerotolerans]|uniref:NAD-dependent epimerase/dehydratase family protein n=1 Tax=Solidesulfovibrio aerotolerans TaxID=295255 RepID=A0A7C9INJ7_9BACT|nr:NAD(P)-dependent oxidoreductase [Solidesulfovibrio aerotolerans]MYL85145.1 NAD-dependent epimerase/dehydratase family protein [Solidesulfovibrio aerotolerans]